MALREYARRLYREAIPLLYARSNYKLFLRRAFTDLDDRLRELARATDVLPSIVRPVPIRAPFGRRVLVVAPHHDDEIIGCGGAMLLQRAAGGDLRVVFVQDGGDEHEADGLTRAEAIARREAEADAVASALGIPAPTHLRHARLEPPHAEAVIRGLADLLADCRPDTLFAPFFLDHNAEHRATTRALAAALVRSGRRPRVLGYEVWGLCVPNVVCNIDPVMDRKRELLALYASQVSGTDYVHAVTGLNMYHSKHFGAGECRFAERFFEMPAAEYVEVVSRVHGLPTEEDAP